MTLRSPYLKQADRKSASSVAEPTVWAILISALLIAFVIGLLVYANIWVWGEVF